MSRLRLRKLARDVWLARTRVAMMVIAIAVSIVAVGGFLGARSILAREVARNYQQTRPASATLIVPGGVTPELLALARATGGVLDAAARGSFQAQLRASGSWQPAVLFVADPTDPRRIATTTPETGSWPPGPDALMLERTAVGFLGTGTGARILVQAPGVAPAPITVAGTVHDGSLAPATQERTAYAFLTTSAARRIGAPATLTELKIVVGGTGSAATTATGDPRRVAEVAQRLATRLAADGSPVTSIQIPPPLRHPHQGQMNTVGFVMLAFGAAALLLSSILVATMLGGMLAGQIRQIGAMKAIGARTGQLLAMYLTLTAAIATTATVVALLPGAALGRAVAGFGARMLNLDLASRAIPPWVYAVEIAAGIGVPLLVALVPLIRGSRITVREAIDDHGVDPAGAVDSGLQRWLARLGGGNRSRSMALRNTVRRRGRLALSLALLGLAGGSFLTGINTATGWSGMVEDGIAVRHYDLEVRLHDPQPARRIQSLLAGVAGVRSVAAWGSQPVTVHRPGGGVDVARVYPDDAHGSFTLLAPPPDTPLITLPVTSGRWLRPGDTDAVVLSNLVPVLQLPGVRVGDTITLTVSGAPRPLRVVGIAADFGTQSTAYVSDTGYAALTGRPGQAATLRIVTDRHDPASRAATLAAVQRTLSAASIGVDLAFPIDELRTGLDQHVLVLADALLGLSVVLIVVALLGLAAMMSTSVTERTREFGVLRTVGATPARVRSIVVTEGTLIGAASLVVAVWFTLPATRVLGTYIGMQAFASPLPYRFSVAALAIWVLAALAGAATASVAAARRASRLTVHDALTTV